MKEIASMPERITSVKGSAPSENPFPGKYKSNNYQQQIWPVRSTEVLEMFLRRRFFFKIVEHPEVELKMLNRIRR